MKPTALVTGATAGIGRYLSVDLARRGYRVFATGRNREALESLSAEARAEGLELETLALDVTDAASIAAAASAVDRLDVLINNAGYGQPGALLEVDDETLRKQFDVNVFGLMAVTRAFAPKLVEQKRGTIINISSTGGRMTFPFFGAYHASKYAVEALSDALRMELAPLGVRVVVIEPGPVHSKFADRAMSALPASTDSLYQAAYARADAIRKSSDRLAVGPDRVARAVHLAIESSCVRPRIMVPQLRFELLFMLLAVLPTSLVDFVFRRFAGLSRRAMAT
jgi:short-subunit dehydrogenase